MKFLFFALCLCVGILSNVSSLKNESSSPSASPQSQLESCNASLTLGEQYKVFCEKFGAKPVPRKQPVSRLSKNKLKVGIVGAGIAGLYSGLLLKSQGVDFRIYEANAERVGGRIYTHRFSKEKNQYFEAGAMRIPCLDDQQQVFQLINYVNEKVNKSDRVDVVDYVVGTDNNYVFVNGVRNNGSLLTRRQARENPAKLNFPIGANRNQTAEQLLQNALKEYIEIAQKNGICDKRITDNDVYSMRSFLILKKGWTEDMVDYVETMTSQTQEFDNSFMEILMELIDVANMKWKTIKDGMSRLPEACKKIIGGERLVLGAKVFKIEETADNKVRLYYKQNGKTIRRDFDKIILAVPPPVIRFLDKPTWPAEKEKAIRSVHYEPLYKIGLRFHSRFWENGSNPSFGGQSITDLPSRWVVYPSVGLGDKDKGVLLLYSRMADALKWLSKSPEEQTELALRDLSNLYGEQLIKKQFIESKSMSWATEWAQGVAMFLPGQYKNLFKILQEPENNVHFAGEYLSVHHTWIVGATDSALTTVRKLLSQPDLDMLKPKGSNLDYCKN